MMYQHRESKLPHTLINEYNRAVITVKAAE
jgi:hypothetical protein